MLLKVIIAALIACVVTGSSIHLLRPLALRVGLVDEPGGRKLHRGRVPLIGGLSMLLGLGFSSLFLPMSLADDRSLIAGSVILVFVGMLDDFRELSTRARLIAEVIAGLLMAVWGGVALYTLGDLLGFGTTFYFPFLLAVILTVVATVGIINAVNMTDGMDGFAGSVALLQFLLLLVVARNTQDAYLISVYIAMIVGFLIFNFPLGSRRALVFMGDAGSMLIGFSLVWFLIKFSQGNAPLFHPVVALWVMALPLYETGCAIIRRLIKRRSPFAPDLDHAHHILQRRGLSPLQIIMVMNIFSVLMGTVGIVSDHFHVAEVTLFLFFILLAIMYFMVMRGLNRYEKNSR